MLKRISTPSKALALTLSLVFLAACGRGCGKEAAQKNAPSKDAVEALVLALSEGLEAGSAENLLTLFDYRALLEKASSGLALSEEEFEKELATLSADALVEGLPAQIASLSGGAGRLLHLGPYTIDGTTYERFRLTLAPGGFEYICFLLEKTDDGHAVITDVFSMTRGEATSSILRRDIIEYIAAQEEPNTRGFTAMDKLYYENLEVFEEAKELARGGDVAAAVQKLESLPETLRDQRWLFFIRTGLAQGTDEALAAETLEALREKYPNDPAALIHLVDGYMGLDRAEDALSTLERVQKTDASDPYLEFLKANILIVLDRKEEARASVARFLEAEPIDAQAQFISTQLALEAEDYKTVAEGLTALYELIGLVVREGDDPRFDAFLASEESAAYREATKDAPARPRAPAGADHGHDHGRDHGHDHGHDHAH